MIHVAILKTNYLDALLSGEKHVECRLTRNRIAPFGKIRVGDRVYFKEASGSFRATAQVARFEQRDELDETAIDALRAEFGEAIGAPDSFWETKKSARFVVLLWFKKVEEVYRGPRHPALTGRGWLTLDNRHDVYPACVATESGKRKAAKGAKRAG